MIFSLTCCSIWKFDEDKSITSIIRSAIWISSSVDLNESIKWVGRFEIKPTVSVNKKGQWPSTLISLVVVSKVANNRSSSKVKSFLQLLVILINWFIKVDLPAFVYPVIATSGIVFFLLTRLINRFSWIIFSLSSFFLIRDLIWFLFKSIIFSPRPLFWPEPEVTWS